jgi:hypothetical protein
LQKSSEPVTSPRFFWIVATLVLVAVTQGAVVAVRAKYEPRSIRAPRVKLTELPPVLGDWRADPQTADELGVDDKLFEAIGAQDVVTRLYKHPEGWTCSVHMATWHETDEWMPHPPEVCYKGAGFNLRENSNVSLPNHDQARVCEAQFIMPTSGTIVSTIYWYQMGDLTYFNRDGSRPVRQSFWGSPERPPLIKVLMQCGDSESAERDRRLEGLADAVYEFAAGL